MLSKPTLSYFVFGWILLALTNIHNFIPYVGHALAAILICITVSYYFHVDLRKKMAAISFVSILYFPAQILWTSTQSVAMNTYWLVWPNKLITLPLIFLCTLYCISLFHFLKVCLLNDKNLDAAMLATWTNLKSEPRQLLYQTCFHTVFLFFGFATNGWGLLLAVPYFLSRLFSR